MVSSTPAISAEAGDESSPFRKFSRLNIRFRISYYTKWGEHLIICGSDALFGNGNIKKAIWMNPHHEGEELIWQASVSVPDGFSMEYKYYIVDDGLNILKLDADDSRKLNLPRGLEDGLNVDILDRWLDGSCPGVLLSRPAFRRVIFSASDDEESALAELDPRLPGLPDCLVVRFQIHCWRPAVQVFVTGNAQELGSSALEDALPLQQSSSQTWEAYVLIHSCGFPLKYKYLLKTDKGDVQLESGDDFEIEIDPFGRRAPKLIMVSDGHFRGPLWRGAGLALPLFSLNSNASVGCGEFLDLKLLVDLAVKCGLQLLQLLPINDTSVHGMWWDSYPYSALSVFALHPMYLCLSALSSNLSPAIQDEIAEERRRLREPAPGSKYKDVDYEGTVAAKLRIARKVYDTDWEAVFQSAQYHSFFEENKEWLRPYAAFCFLKDSVFGTADHSQWGLLAHFSDDKVDRIVSPDSGHFDSVGFCYYLQFHLHRQLSESAQYARRQRVVLKGDLPIGVSPHSVDTWQYPSLFRAGTSTGAPPDQFDSNGQNWGFPTYNWEEMSRDDYRWWRMRLNQLSKFFSAYRIDHILGFFRIWELPSHAVSGITGHFRPSTPLHAEEMEQRGVWDFNRLCDPYMRTHLLQDVFGSVWKDVAGRFLEPEPQNKAAFRFKEEFNTEKKVVSSLESMLDGPAWLADCKKEVCDGLRALLVNVCLIRDLEDSRKFYPRFDMSKTSSFQALDEHSQTVLSELAQDYFYVRQEALWRRNGMKTLPALMAASNMLTCGEDLGFVPACVPPVLEELGLLGLRIQRMPATAEEFADPAEYPYLSVCAPSCHDCSTLRAWWEEDADRQLRFAKAMLPHLADRLEAGGSSSSSSSGSQEGQAGEAGRALVGEQRPVPRSCSPEIVHAVLMQHCRSPSVWAIFPLQDLMALKEKYADRPAEQETINDPTNPRHYWKYRVHVPVESLLADGDFLLAVRNMLLETGRCSDGDGS